MSWQEFCKLNKVPYKYLNCSIGNLKQFKNEATEFIENYHSIILMGDSGRGKTYFQYALIHQLLEKQEIGLSDLRYINALELENKVDDCINEYRSASGFIYGLCDVFFLFIDDFGIEPTVQRAERNYYTLTDKRLSNNMPTIFATNLTDHEISYTYGSRIHSRMKQCRRINFTGRDWRTIENNRRENHEQIGDNKEESERSDGKKIFVQFS